MLDIDELNEKFLNLEFDSKDFVIDVDKVTTAAKAAGETLPRFTDPGDPDFQAVPSFLASMASGRSLPIDFPKLGGIGMDGGKAIEVFKPVPVGEPLTGRTHLHEIYDKTGRSGRMVFIVSRMEIYNQDNEHLATTDSRMVIRERPSK